MVYFIRAVGGNSVGFGPGGTVQKIVTVSTPEMNNVSISLPVEDRKQTVTLSWDKATDASKNREFNYTVLFIEY